MDRLKRLWKLGRPDDLAWQLGVMGAGFAVQYAVLAGYHYNEGKMFEALMHTDRRQMVRLLWRGAG
jgi:hypothetical protein